MTTDGVLASLCGLFCLVASFSVGLHEILLSPDRPNYPTGRKPLRVMMFIWCGVLGYRALEYLQGAASAAPPSPTLGQFFGCFMVAAVHATFLENHLRSWLPARTQDRIRRLLHIATCGEAQAMREERRRNNSAVWPGARRATDKAAVVGPALAELKLAGFVVVAPNEGPEALAAEEGAIKNLKSHRSLQ